MCSKRFNIICYSFDNFFPPFYSFFFLYESFGWFGQVFAATHPFENKLISRLSVYFSIYIYENIKYFFEQMCSYTLTSVLILLSLEKYTCV